MTLLGKCLFILFVSTTYVACDIKQWIKFKEQFRKSYNNDKEEEIRFRTFTENLREIEEHNTKYEKGLVAWSKRINEFADWTQDELGQFRLGLKIDEANFRSSNRILFRAPPSFNPPPEINWVELGAVTPVKQQGKCQSCWSFSATGALEGQYFIKYGKLVSLSEQNLVDCSPNHGCRGGFMNPAFDYVREYGIDTEKSYPYTATNGTCQFNPSDVVLRVNQIVEIESGNEDDLKKAIAFAGPVSVAADASLFFFYFGGIHSSDGCSGNVNHAMLAVGYGTDANGEDYWLIKNSWGTQWGEDGYMRVARNKNNTCGIATIASFPQIK